MYYKLKYIGNKNTIILHIRYLQCEINKLFFEEQRTSLLPPIYLHYTSEYKSSIKAVSPDYYAKIQLIKQDFTQLYGRPWCLSQGPYFLLSLKEIFAKYLNYVKLPELPE